MSDVNRGRDDRSPSAASFERIILYVEDFAAATGQDLSPELYGRVPADVYVLSEPDGPRPGRRSSLYPPSPDSPLGFQLGDRSALYPPNSGERLPCPNPLCPPTNAPRRSRSNLDVDQRSSRRSSVQSSRSRTNSCSRPTPLGDDRRASVCKKSRPRRASTVSARRDSVRPTKTDVQQTRKMMEDDARDPEQARRHRRIATVVVGTFIFLLVASVLAVVVTLTHSSFLSPVVGSKELTEYRAQLRKENEELLNSLNRDNSVPENVTAPP
ncbi:hypothetical protein EAI_09908 [Harpegnathos saltator]|uniref:Uncharacterized protein n=1 Tax=Harpegnathos saltator TaxID=610380 RepID=E2BEY3_HARSA|nr:hypothetical protein EAI_09908 [Harpegnathos saltator]